MSPPAFRVLPFDSGAGASTDFIGTIAKDHGVHLVVGVIERDGGTLYCTALMFAPAAL